MSYVPLSEVLNKLASILDQIEAQSSFAHGQTTVGTTPVQLTTSSVPAVKGILVKAHKDNNGKIYIGKDNTVTTSTGFELAAGEAVTIEVDDANKIWLVADSDDQVVSWIVV